MPHIQIKDCKEQRQWINTDSIVLVNDETAISPMAVYIRVLAGEDIQLRGKHALRFLDEYQRLCVAQQRPEVG